MGLKRRDAGCPTGQARPVRQPAVAGVSFVRVCWRRCHRRRLADEHHKMLLAQKFSQIESSWSSEPTCKGHSARPATPTKLMPIDENTTPADLSI